YFPPQAFTIADKLGIIQNDLNIPSIYHLRRNKADMRLPSNHLSIENNRTDYSKDIPKRDFMDMHRIKGNYWWLKQDAVFLYELNKRARYKKSDKRETGKYKHR
ncbi:hypothetical protein PV327_011633, partial [Microctonus hyperodae]